MIYLDCAATTLQKPAAVSNAAAWSINHLTSPGRGGHRPAMEAGDIAFRCRQAAAELFHVNDPARVVFTFHATHALNIAIRTLVKPGTVVLTSGYEHNAVTRPLAAIPDVKQKVAAAPLFQPEEFLKEFQRQLTDDVTVVVCTHVSNVFGYVLPIEEVARLCREKNVPLIVDASQSAGCIPIHMDELGAAFIAMPGHKGLYGPQGTGLLLCGETPPEPLLQGGTGSISLRQTMPDFLPDSLEAGTHNVPGIAGLLEGLKFVAAIGEKEILGHEQTLIFRAAEQLHGIDGVRVFDDPLRRSQSGVCSFFCEGIDCEEVGEMLGRQGTAVRAGLHCAPLAHQNAGTLKCGTVRMSVSVFNEEEEIDQFVSQLRKILKK